MLGSTHFRMIFITVNIKVARKGLGFVEWLGFGGLFGFGEGGCGFFLRCVCMCFFQF